jgi:hypothetical protein
MAKPDDDYADDPPRRPARRPEAEHRGRPDDEDDEVQDVQPVRRPGPERRPRRDDDEEDDYDRPRRRERVERVRRRSRDDDYDEDEEDDRGVVEMLIPTSNPKSLIAYYCGIFGLIPPLGLILGPLALLFGILGIRFAGRYRKAKGGGHSIAGIILGPIDFLVSVGAIVWITAYIHDQGVGVKDILTR